MTAPPSISFHARVNDSINLAPELPAIAVVRKQCELSRSDRRVKFYCLPCRRDFSTLLELDEHLETAGDHKVCWSCPLHGPEAI